MRVRLAVAMVMFTVLSPLHGIAAADELELLAVAVPPTDLAGDVVVRTMFARLLRKTHYGFNHTEAASFIVRDALGNWSWLEWPASDVPDSCRWQGALPRGTVAIVHTHPSFMPHPSQIDVASSRRIGVPIYVITPFEVSKTDGVIVQIVMRGRWE